MKRAKTSVKVAIASAVVISSTAAVIYAAPKILEATNSTGAQTKIYLNVEKIDADKVKVSLDNIEDIAKSVQFSIKLDGDIALKDGENGIKDLINKEVEERISNNGYSGSNSIFTDYTYDLESNIIDIIITSEDSLPKTENKIDIFELSIVSNKADDETVGTFNIIPENEEQYKYVSKANKEYDDIVVEYNKSSISLNTAPEIKYTSDENIKLFDGDTLVFNNIKEIVTSDAENDDISLEVRNITNVEESKEDSQAIINEFSSEDIGTYTFKVYAVDSKGDKSEAIKVLVDVTYDLNLENPIINGIEDMELQSGSIFKPLDGVTAIDAKGRELNVNVTGDLDLDPEEDTVYTLKYSATDKYGKVTEVERKVKVIANKAPVINGVENVVINIGEKFDIMSGVTAIDDIDGDLTSAIVSSGQVNTSISGEYKITYTVTDSGNKTTRAQRVVRVNRAPIVSGHDSTLVVKIGTKVTEEMILDGIIINDESDYSVEVKIPNISQAGRYEATIIVTDSDNAVTTVGRDIVVSAESVTELPNSGQGTSESDAKVIQVVDEEGINILNEKLSAATKEYSIATSKKQLTEYTQYTFIISKKEAIFRSSDKIYVNVRVPNNIEESTGGISITEYVEILASEISIDNKESLSHYISKGDEIILIATIKPDNVTNKEIDWVSSNEEVLEIIETEKGIKVIAKEYGIATIKVGATDGSEKYDEFTFNVAHNFKELPEGITVVSGDASEEDPVTYKTESIEALNELLSNAKEDFKIVLQDKKVLGEETVEYYLKIEEKGLIAKLFRKTNSYYIALRVPNTTEFEDVLYSLEKDDIKAPTLIYSGLTEITIENGSVFDIPSVKAVDNLDKHITVKYVIKDYSNKVISSIDTNIAGEYSIIYSCIDSSGNKSKELLIKVIVLEDAILEPELPGEGLGPDGDVMPEVTPDEPEVPGEDLDGDVMPEVTPEKPNISVDSENENDSDLPQAGGRNALALGGLGAIIVTLGGVLVFKKNKK